MDYKKMLHRGEKFASRGAGLFLKDVIHDGVWVHPLTNQTIVVTPEIRASQVANTNMYIKNGNRVPMPDGHTTATEANKGFWPGPFVAMGDDVLGIAQPLDAKTKQQMLDGTADAVSVGWYSKYFDSKKVEYQDVFEHICLTNYPVIGRQRNFIQLSGKKADDESPHLYSADVLMAVAVPEEDEELLSALDKVANALKQGAQREIENIMRTPAEKLAVLMSKCPVK